MLMPKLDKKDYAILRELDLNYRKSFARIAKKVRLSKNSVALRFEKLRPYISHALTSIDFDRLGYTEVRIFYTFGFYNKSIEEEIVEELKTYKNVAWATRFYGRYDLLVCFMFRDVQDFISQVERFNQRFEDSIIKKDMQILSDQKHIRHNFIHKEPVYDIFRVKAGRKKYGLSDTSRKILLTMMHNPRMNITDISKKTGLSTKTVSNNIKKLEKDRIIIGYFPTYLPVKFNHVMYKLLLRVQNQKIKDEFDSYLTGIKNIRFIAKTIGLWDYEIDAIYPNITSLQKEIENMNEKFQKAIKRVEIMSLGVKIYTNERSYLEN